MNPTLMTANRLAYPELRGSLQTLKYPAFAEVKLDGELAWHVWGAGDVAEVIVGKNGKITERFIVDGKPRLISDKRHGITIGELYADAGKFGDLYKMRDVSFQPLHYRPFDILTLNGDDLTGLPLIERKEILFSEFPDLPTPTLIENINEAMTTAKAHMHNGYEGIVLKNIEERYKTGPCAWVKVKTKDENVYEVILIDPAQERIEFIVPMPNGKSRSVSAKCLNRDKATLKLGDLVKIEHQGVLALGGLRHPVYKGKA